MSLAVIALDRYAALNENFVLIAGPHSGPRRAERAKQALPTSQGRGPVGISRASPWLVFNRSQPFPRLARRVHCGTLQDDMPSTPMFIRWFSEIMLSDVPLVGGKNASLGEMYRNLSGAGVRVPNGFAITADAYRHFMHATGLAATVDTVTRGLEPGNLAELAERGLAIRQAIVGAALPDDL